MEKLLSAMMTWLPFTVTPVLLLCFAPTATARRRRIIAVLLMLGAAAIAAAFAPSELRELKIINPFIDPEPAAVPHAVVLRRARCGC